MTDLQAMYYLAGRAHHGVIEACLGDKLKDDRVDAGEFQKHDIYYSPDLRMPYPWEIKTTRSMYEPKSDYEKKFEGYLNQLTQYQVMEDTDKGGLLLFYLCLKQAGQFGMKPAIRFYKVIMTKAERVAKLKWMRGTKKALDKAIETKTHDALDLCPEFMCKECLWISKCSPCKDDPKRKQYDPTESKDL